MKMFFETLNKQCVPYFYTCKVYNMAVPLMNALPIDVNSTENCIIFKRHIFNYYIEL